MEKNFLKLQNGSDVRGVAVAGVADEPVNLTTETVNKIASGFVKFLSAKLGKQKLFIMTCRKLKLQRRTKLKLNCGNTRIRLTKNFWMLLWRVKILQKNKFNSSLKN